MGIVRAYQKGDLKTPPTLEVQRAASSMNKTDVKKFASTKHKGLPEKKVTKESFNEDYVKELEDGLVKMDYPTYDEVDELMKKIAKDNGIDTTVLHMAFKTKHLMVPDDWAKKKMMEPVMIPKTPLKSVEECWKTHKKVGMKMKGGKLVNDCRPKNEEYVAEISLPTDQVKKKKNPFGKRAVAKAVVSEIGDAVKRKVKSMTTVHNEGSLHKWFSGSKSKDGKGGWVNVVTGGTCASDEPGEGTPKCVSSSKRASMTKAERKSAARRKKAADPNQQSKSGAAKPTYVSTDKKKAVKESKEMSENFMLDKSYVQRYKKAGGYLNTPARKKADAEHAKNNPKRKPFEPIKRGTMVGNKLNDEVQYEAKDKKKAVKEDFLSMILEVSDAKMFRQSDENLDKLKKKFDSMDDGPANTFMRKRIAKEVKRREQQKRREMLNPTVQIRDDFMPEITEDCWDGYEKKGMKTMFGKRYPNCVKKKRKTRKEEFEVAEDYYSGKGEINVKRTKDFMDSKGMEGAPGLNAMKMRQQEHKDKRGKKKEKGVKEGMAYGMYKGSGKPSGPMAAYLKKKKEEEKKKKVSEGKKYKRDEYGDPIKPDGSYAGKKNEDKNPKDEKITRSESYSANRKQQAAIAIAKLEKKENDTVKKKLEKNSYEPDTSLVEGTPAWQRKAGKSESGGLNAKGVASYRAANPGSKLKTAVTTKPSKLKKGSKAANRRKSFCKRMSGMKKKLTSAKTARDPDSRINKALRKWNCSFEPENGEVLSETMLATIKRKVQVLGGGSNKKPAPKTTGRDAGAIAKKVLQQKQHNKYVNFLPMDEEKKKCGEGEYYCNDDKKCKPIPKGYRIGYGGYLKPENKEDESNGKKGGSNGNGNGHGGNGNGHGGNGNGGNGGGNGGGE